MAWAMTAAAGNAAIGAPEIRFLASAEIPAQVEGVAHPVGGISGLAYDAQRDVWIAVCDGRARGMALELKISLGPAVTMEVPARPTLRIERVREITIPWPAGARRPLDAEAVAVNEDGYWYIGYDAPACVTRVDPATAKSVTSAIPGALQRAFRPNRGFESVALVPTPTGVEVWAGSENALATEEIATRNAGQRCRVIVMNPKSLAPLGGYVYLTEPLDAQERSPMAYRALGEFAALPDGRVLALEKYRSSHAGESAQIYLVSRPGPAGSVGAADAPELEKTLLADLTALGVASQGTPEAMALGPAVGEDGAESLLIVIEDNNLAPGRGSQVVALSFRP